MICDKNGNDIDEVYGKSGNAVNVAYDINGNVIFPDSSHPIVPPLTQLDYSVNSYAWGDNGNAQYPKFKQAFLASPLNTIPFFVNTDTHGTTGIDANRWFHNVNDILAVNLALGDICVDTYTPYVLERYVTRTTPVDNFIGIVGNHDVKQGTDAIPTQQAIRSYFTDSVKYRKQLISNGDTANFVVYDDYHNVKFICLDWYTRIGVDTTDTMPQPYTTTEVTAWFLDELAVNDKYDIIVLQHALFTDTYVHDDGTRQGWADAPTCIERLWTVLKDRKNKRSGTYSDAQGESHSYDFATCQTDLIVVFNGHAHEQLHLREDGLTAFAFDKFYQVNMGYLDRTNNLMHLWKFTYNGTTAEQTFAI